MYHIVKCVPSFEDTSEYMFDLSLLQYEMLLNINSRMKMHSIQACVSKHGFHTVKNLLASKKNEMMIVYDTLDKIANGRNVSVDACVHEYNVCKDEFAANEYAHLNEMGAQNIFFGVVGEMTEFLNLMCHCGYTVVQIDHNCVKIEDSTTSHVPLYSPLFELMT